MIALKSPVFKGGENAANPEHLSGFNTIILINY